MQDLIGEETVSNEIREALVETLRAGAATIGPETSIVRDLGAESLDFLDLNYRLEQTFSIRMARHFFLEHMEEMFGEGSAIDENGRLTPRALAVLRARFPEATLPEHGDGIDMDEVPCPDHGAGDGRHRDEHPGHLPERCSCGESAWRAEDGTHIVCGTCRQPAAFTNGDELTRQWLSSLSEWPGLP